MTGVKVKVSGPMVERVSVEGQMAEKERLEF
jgi:hypothetical protein